MATVGVLKALMWVLKYLGRGLSNIGLAMHGCPTRPDPTWPDEAETGLTPDELLWQAELAEGGSERRRSAVAMRREAASQNSSMCWFPQPAPRRDDA